MNVRRTSPRTPWHLRPPDPGDGAALHELITHCPPLDLNSCYCYLLQSLHFADTCVLADLQGTPGAYISGYLPPGRPDTLFIWQVAVAPALRGQGLACALLHHLLARPACHQVRWLETTVSPDNRPSTRLFQGLAQELRCACTVSDLFSPGAFGATPHAAEQLFRLGPFVSSPASISKEKPHGNVDLRTP